LSIWSNLRRVWRHREILANPELREQVLAYVAERTRSDGTHQVWTGRLTDQGAPQGVIHERRVVEWNNGDITKGVRFDPRLISWAADGQPFDDSVVVLPACGYALCLSHLEAVPWTALGPE
jgi:hypothetical protein